MKTEIEVIVREASPVSGVDSVLMSDGNTWFGCADCDYLTRKNSLAVQGHRASHTKRAAGYRRPVKKVDGKTVIPGARWGTFYTEEYIRTVAEMYIRAAANGSSSPSTTAARYLNKGGYRTGRNKLWTASTVQYVWREFAVPLGYKLPEFQAFDISHAAELTGPLTDDDGRVNWENVDAASGELKVEFNPPAVSESFDDPEDFFVPLEAQHKTDKPDLIAADAVDMHALGIPNDESDKLFVWDIRNGRRVDECKYVKIDADTLRVSPIEDGDRIVGTFGSSDIPENEESLDTVVARAARLRERAIAAIKVWEKAKAVARERLSAVAEQIEEL